MNAVKNEAMIPSGQKNPTDGINVNLTKYIDERKNESNLHSDKGIPDYAYCEDLFLRQKIKAMPGVYPVLKAYVANVVPYMKQYYNMEALRVGPNQFPDVYKAVIECAKRLNIGVPELFVVNSPVLNAQTIPLDSEAPIMAINSGLLERFNLSELKAVIGHECGHIHNEHGIFSIAIEQVPKMAAAAISPLFTQAVQFPLNAWSRAGETTSDRAALICADDPQDAFNAIGKLIYGAAFGRTDVNIDEIIKQYDKIHGNIVRVQELFTDHPVVARRLIAMREFMKADVLYSWRPELKTPGMETVPKREIDEICKGYISVMKTEKRK